jgi:hypothetical protein
MLFVGTREIGQYVITVQPSPMELMENKFYLSESMKPFIAPYTKPYEDLNRDYYHCRVERKTPLGVVMVDLNKETDFDCVSFQFPPKPIKYKSKKNKHKSDEDDKKEVPPTAEELIYETEYRFWRHNHDINTYLDTDLYLHRTSVEKVIAKCLEKAS